jgi:hypothetical protein
MGKKNILITESQLEDLLKSFINMITGNKSGGFNFSSLFGMNPKKTSSVEFSNMKDKDFYSKLLKELGAPVSNENLKFMYAWRQSEGKAGKYNPFNTTWDLPGSTKFNSVGVRNYQSLEDGYKATLKTLKNGRYNCIVNGLKNDIGAKQISTNCINDLKTWGTGSLVGDVVSSYDRGSTPKPSSLTA